MTGNEFHGKGSGNSEDEMKEPHEDMVALKPRIQRRQSEERKEAFENADSLDWDNLQKEFSWDKIWTTRSGSEIVKNFAISLLFGLIPTISDVVTDGLSANSFLSGTVYTKHITDLSLLNKTNTHGCTQLTNVSNPFDPDARDCVHTGSFITYTHRGPIIQYEVIECFETDPVGGYMILALIFLPGFLGTADILSGCGRSREHILCWTLFPFFPLLLLAAKLVALFNPGEHWKKLTFRLTLAEGAFESKATFILQLYIIFTRADRQP